ncbi:MAG: ribonuclease E/G [Alphaproteobacteria bacterium]|nr:ribonuclease E/G [Alphaproteobacteria bacterium]
MKILTESSCGETRIAFIGALGPEKIIIRRDLVLNFGDKVRAKIKAYHPTLKGYFAETGRGDVFIPTHQSFTEGASVEVLITKEPRGDKVATGHLSDKESENPDIFGTEITAAEMDELVAEAMIPDVHLKNGGMLHIEKTRVCWTIDVDSGENTDILSHLNESALPEIVRQITLKNMGGLILIDFAGSKRGKSALNLLKMVRELFQGQDTVTIHGWTSAGLLEIEKKREYADLWTTCSENNPVNIYYRVRRALSTGRVIKPLVRVAPAVFKLLQGKDLRAKLEPVCDFPVSYFEVKEEK